jgi:hypothetical protein
VHRITGALLRARLRPSVAIGATVAAAALTVSPADAFGATHLADAAQTTPTTTAPTTTTASKPAAKPAARNVHHRRHARGAHHFVVPASMVRPLRALRGCESGGNYRADTGNGFYGAYQFDYGTWRGLGYAGVASDAPPWKQDQAVVRLHAQRGWEPWPACSRYLGLA